MSDIIKTSMIYCARPKNETCAFSEGLTHHCTAAGGVGYENFLDWPPWKEPLPTRAWLTTPYYAPLSPVLRTSQIAPILEPVFFRFLGLRVCNAKAHVLTAALMRGVPNPVVLTGGYMGVFFMCLLARWCPFFRAQIVSTCLFYGPFPNFAMSAGVKVCPNTSGPLDFEHSRSIFFQ